MQMPHDLLSWLTVGSILLGGLWWVLKNTIVNSITGLRNDILGLKNELRRANQITDNHEIRLTKLETWKHDKWEV
ncbi:hypothetical protein [Leuconostoc carnosum]|uniref:hypothetical protein n=1 Tax=Leuconostoc carnosum TaxID=1252 RepID=UPI0012394A59|nr:hypothetical protein [Leuconostoc carnosum]KAA8369791.1 hypothetical protein FE414_07075 [Leuconostoc carnosum]KAA8372356.1 hypothetical protein FE412_07290 [Leuconostoc carnosum]